MKMKRFTMLIVSLLALALGVGTALAVVIPNGDFSSGNANFNSAYAYFAQPASPASSYSNIPNTPASLYDEGTYGVGINPALYHVSWASFGDHTSGTGNMMIVNGATNAANVEVWQVPQSGTIPVTIGQTYRFSAWLASLYRPGDSIPTAPANLAFSINDVQIGSDFLLSAAVGTWQLFSVDWVANAATADLSLININTAVSGNDFAIDDISLQPVPEPGTMMLLGSGLLGLAGWGRKRFKK